MTTYVLLVKFTEQGAKNARETVQRAGAFRADLERRGCKLRDIYWTRGQFDLVETVEGPDDQTTMAAILALTGLGNVRTQVLHAFGESDMRAIIEKL